MNAAEVFCHLRRRWRVWKDEHRQWDWGNIAIGQGGTFPQIPAAGSAPGALREALARESGEIQRGHWRAFGHLRLEVDRPPRWHCDYLAGRDLVTNARASQLAYRTLPHGADIKLIWELSRWTHLTRLAMAAHVLGDRTAAERCEQWLWDWREHNPPGRGWNWTSALEAGLRLVQLTWMDALIRGQFRSGVEREAWDALMTRLLPVHVHFVWRHRSFGSSANNHLLGELAGLTVATVRWPRLAQWGVSIGELQRLLEREVLSQFTEDGGNREQALNYHLFAFELCWQARMALHAAGRKLAPLVEERLRHAARFFWEVQVEREPWDYGDSDSAHVFPGVTSEAKAVSEWRGWFSRSGRGAALDYWLGDPPVLEGLGAGQPRHTVEAGDWWVFPQSGIGICECGFWFLRWDLSALGYLRTAAHGHLDALHLSLWHRGVAIVVDPGTGAYFADPALRSRLAARSSHNGPCPAEEMSPSRLGPFLWSNHHRPPGWGEQDVAGAKQVWGELQVEDGTLKRCVRRIPEGDGWEVTDHYERTGGRAVFTVLWQFAPGARVQQLTARRYRVVRGDVSLEVELSEGWRSIECVESEVSPAFRQVVVAPGLRLTGEDSSCVLSTRFLACPGA